MKNEITKRTVAGITKEIKALLEGNRSVTVHSKSGTPGVSYEKENIYCAPGNTFSFNATSFTEKGALTSKSRRNVESLVRQIKRDFEIVVKVY